MKRTKEEALIDTAVHMTRAAKETDCPTLREAYRREAQEAVDEAANCKQLEEIRRE